jgi:hypothetical protein
LVAAFSKPKPIKLGLIGPKTTPTFLNPGNWCLFDPGSGKAFFRIPDPGSQTHIFGSSVTNLWVKSTIIPSVLAKKFLYMFKYKSMYKFMMFVATKNKRTKTFFPSSFGAVVGSGIRDPGSGRKRNIAFILCHRVSFACFLWMIVVLVISQKRGKVYI